MKFIDNLYDKMNDIFESIWAWIVNFFTTGAVGDFLTSFLSESSSVIVGLLSSIGLPILCFVIFMILMNEQEHGGK